MSIDVSSRRGSHGLASEVGESIPNGVNKLCALLAWNDAGAIEAPPLDGEMLKATIDALKHELAEAHVQSALEVGADPPMKG